MAVSHYDVLGVASDAAPEEIRQAYRQRARDVHPDRQAEVFGLDHRGHEGVRDGDGTLRAMQVLNEAWRVLGDRNRRAAYDRLLAEAEATPVAERWSAVDFDDRPFHPRGPHPTGASLVRSLPWVAVLVVLGGIFVFTAFAGGSDGAGGSPSASDLVGSCVQLERGGVVNQVPCDGPSDGRVDLVTVRASLCPEGADVVRLASQESWLCLRDPSSG